MMRAGLKSFASRRSFATSLTGSKDLQMVNITLRVLSKPNTSELAWIYKRLGRDYGDRVLPSIAIQNNPGFVKLRKIDTAKEIAGTVARSQGKVYLNADSLLINILGNEQLGEDNAGEKTRLHMRALLLVAALHSALAVFHNPLVDQANRGHFGKEREALRQIEQVLNTYGRGARARASHQAPAPRAAAERERARQGPAQGARPHAAPPRREDAQEGREPPGQRAEDEEEGAGFFKKPKKGNTNGHGFTSFTPI
ncbi:prohibitin [Aureococcus anophagefferens]|uniref:Prohibitin n=1 Tax=Aureococcus anophagefferens TaxID=44056 RepID=A0ABR1FTI9_AURAN